MTYRTDGAGNLLPFSLPQTVFMLSLASNFLFDVAEDEARLLKRFREYLGVPGQKAGSFFTKMNAASPNHQCLACPPDSSGPADWQIAWGPALFKAHHNTGATNAAFVAYSAKLKTYVTAIAGTNPLGTNALLFQDLDVAPKNMVEWPPRENTKDTPPSLVWTSASHPKASQHALAEGTSYGLSRLYRMEAPGMADPEGKPVTLRVFLDSVADTSATLIFTGHSLGGALSPILALLLYPEAAKPVWKNVYILATAGPTPGNAGLKGAFDKTYRCEPAPPYTHGGKQGGFAHFTHWNANYVNIFDVVPRAWDKLDKLAPIPVDPLKPWPSFFSGNATLEPKLGGVVSVQVSLLKERAGYKEHKTDYYAPALEQKVFTGQWGSWGDDRAYPPVWVPKPPLRELTDFAQLSASILDAHLPQYPFAFLGVNAPPGDLQDGSGDL